MKRRLLATLVLALAVAGCPEGSDSAETDRDAMDQRQRDSVTSTLPIPGAGAVGSALDATDAAAERAARQDSLAGGN